MPRDESHWQQAVRDQQEEKPKMMDLRLRDANQAQTKPVTFSENLQQKFQSIRDNPKDFVISTAVSMGTFMAVKALAFVALGSFATPLLAAMVAAAVIASVRGTSAELEARDERVAALKRDTENPPTAEDLATASQINTAGIAVSALKHAAISGVIGSVFGYLLSEAIPNLFPDATPEADPPTVEESPHTDIGHDVAGAVTVLEKDGYTVIKIQNPAEVFFNKDSISTPGIDHAAEDALIINGPLFEKEPHFGDTTGPYIVNGEMHGGTELTDPNDARFVRDDGIKENFAYNNGIMGQKMDGEMFLMTYEEWQESPLPVTDIKWAFQNPTLLDQDHSFFGDSNNHNPHSPTTEPKGIERSALGYDKDNNLIFIHSHADTPTNFNKMGEYLAAEGAVDGMYLDGDKVGYIHEGTPHGKIVNGSTTMHFRINNTASHGHSL